MRYLFVPRTAMFAVVIAFAVGLAVFVAIAISKHAFVALLSANGLLISALVVSSSAGTRAVIIALSVVAFTVIALRLPLPLAGALSFAVANAVEIAVAVLLIRQFNDAHAAPHKAPLFFADAALREEYELAQEMRQALADGAFEVHYQPIINVATHTVVSLEALVRWHHDTRGPISPERFIPIAEDFGLIGEIGDFVLRRACSDAANWPTDVKVSVNFSCAQFDSSDVKTSLEAALADAGIPPGRLQLEITETMVMPNIDRANALLDDLRELGIEIVMDDFGTGYSSLSCLRSCSFDRLKIDRSFIRDLTTSLEARAILRMIVRLAATLGMHTTAEGIETFEQFEIIREEGCGEVQGFLFSRPKTVEEVAAFFATAADNSNSAA